MEKADSAPFNFDHTDANELTLLSLHFQLLQIF